MKTLPTFEELTEDQYRLLTEELELLRRFDIKFEVEGYKDLASPAYISEEFDSYEEAVEDANSCGLITRINPRRELTRDERARGWLILTPEEDDDEEDTNAAVIVHNKILYKDHAVVFDKEHTSLYKEEEGYCNAADDLPAYLSEYMTDMRSLLTPDGSAEDHEAELEGMHNDGSGTVEPLEEDSHVR